MEAGKRGKDPPKEGLSAFTFRWLEVSWFFVRSLPEPIKLTVCLSVYSWTEITDQSRSHCPLCRHYLLTLAQQAMPGLLWAPSLPNRWHFATVYSCGCERQGISLAR